jgi:hypothetical protein
MKQHPKAREKEDGLTQEGASLAGHRWGSRAPHLATGGGRWAPRGARPPQRARWGSRPELVRHSRPPHLPIHYRLRLPPFRAAACIFFLKKRAAACLGFGKEARVWVFLLSTCVWVVLRAWGVKWIVRVILYIDSKTDKWAKSFWRQQLTERTTVSNEGWSFNWVSNREGKFFEGQIRDG